MAYDYGMGAVWGFVLARSKDELATAFPDLEIFDEPPSWMSEDQLNAIAADSTFDLDNPSNYPEWATAKNS